MLIRPGLRLCGGLSIRNGISAPIILKSRTNTNLSSLPSSSSLFHTSRIVRENEKINKSNIVEQSSTAAIEKPSNNNTTSSDILATYSAPLAKTFVRLKVFSLSSLAAAIALTPALLFAPADVGWSGRIGLSITALATSGASTAIFAWIGKPYVGSMKLLSAERANSNLRKDALGKIGETETNTEIKSNQEIDLLISKPALQAQTTDWRLRKLQTTIYEPDLIRPTSRPLATWELTSKAPALQSTEKVEQQYPITRLIAATRMEKDGKLIGRWWANWQAPGQIGQCIEEGNVIRHYSIHEELLGDDWRVL